jgi:hypothetical protein
MPAMPAGMACVPPPPPAVDGQGAPTTDPITGQPRASTTTEAPPKRDKFPLARGPHLCAKGEDVAFSCTIEADERNRRPLTSVCISYKTGKPMIVVKEMPEGGKVQSPFEDSTGASAVSSIKIAGNPVGFEVRTNRAIYMILKKGPVEVDGGTLYKGPTTYIRMLTIGPIETTATNEGRCESDQTTRITDNIEAFVRLAN